ncbi:hypothetical protein T492DRAFT_853811 [Pavlovales sp. CCMP2436]|nr:hypothetical protein T492DRAFT_853811 [Pavlovales sp. CCMP2436]
MARKKSHREARNHREPAGLSPIEHIGEHLKKRWIDLACASSPLRAHRWVRTPAKASAHDSAKFGAMDANDPEFKQTAGRLEAIEAVVEWLRATDCPDC